MESEEERKERKRARKEAKRLAKESTLAPDGEARHEDCNQEAEDVAEAAAAKAARKAARKAAKEAAAALTQDSNGLKSDDLGTDGARGSQKRPRDESGGCSAGIKKVFYSRSSKLPNDGGVSTAAYRVAKKIVVEDPLGESSVDAWAPLSSFEYLGDNFTAAQKSVLSGFKEPTPIQAQSWPIALSGRDMVGIASTGSGKTIAFLLPALVHIAAQAPLVGGGRGGSGPIMLVLSPTRELAMQTADVAERAGKACGLSSICIYGGVSKGPQIAALSGRGGGTHIVVATPGRLRDLMETSGVSLARVTFVVLDEADRMLDEGFEREVRSILGAIPAAVGSGRQTLMFSATWPDGVRGIAATFMQSPVRVTIGSAELSASHSVTQRVEVLEPGARDSRLVKLLGEYHAERTNRILIFVLYKKEADRVSQFLERLGWKNCAIHGDMSQEARTRSFSAFKSGTIPLLVATDVAARGLDIPNVEYVINYSFPLTIEDYIHRIGRTGRGGKTGLAHTFFTVNDKSHSGELVNVLKEAGADVPQDLVNKFGCTVSFFFSFYLALTFVSRN